LLKGGATLGKASYHAAQVVFRMNSLAIAFAFASACCLGAGLVLTQLGLRDLPPLSGAAISIPSSTLLFVAAAPFALAGEPVIWAAVPIFAAVGLLYPGTVTLLTFAANRALGPVITSALGNLTPLFAVGFAVLMLGEPLRPTQFAGVLVIVAGVVILTVVRRQHVAQWLSWALLLPLLAAGVRGFIQPTIKLGLEIWPSPFAAALFGYIVSSAVVIAANRLQSGRFVAEAPWRGRGWFAVTGVFNGFASLLLYAALANGPVALVSPLVATYPLLTIAGSMLILGRIVGGWRLAFGVALTVIGVALLLVG
jgi:drug/metabolite transporter (DMT)-like permease